MAIGSPILNRELLTFLRGKRAFVGLLIYLAILSAASALTWYGTLEAFGALQRDLVSRYLFYTITIAQLLIFSAYALILTCTKINSEQDEKTLELLVTAPIRNIHIILAKYASSLAVILLMVVASAPALSLCFLMGGVSWHEFLSAYYIILLAVLSYGMMGIACSTLFRKNYVSLFVGFFMALLFYGGATLILLILVQIFHSPLHIHNEEKIVVGFFEVTSPLGLYIFSIITPVVSSILLPYFRQPVIGHTIFQGLVFLISLLIARRRFRLLSGRTTPAQRQREIIRAFRARRTARVAAQMPTRKAGGRRRYRPIPDRYNPVYAREDRQFLSRKWRHRILRFLMLGTAFAILAFILRESWHGRSYRFDNEMIMLGIGTVFVVTLFVPLLAARSVTSEREIQSLPLLVTTLMRPAQVIFGKLLVVLKHAFRAEVIFTFLLLLLLPRKPPFPILIADWIKVLLPLFAITLFFVSIGLFFSVLCRKTTTAVVLTYGTVLLLAFSPLIFIIVVEIFESGNRQLMDSLQSFLALVGPIASPLMYFIPEDNVNFWHDNDKWASILGYSAVMISLSAVQLMSAEMKFARLFRGRSGREGPPPATQP